MLIEIAVYYTFFKDKCAFSISLKENVYRSLKVSIFRDQKTTKKPSKRPAKLSILLDDDDDDDDEEFGTRAKTPDSSVKHKVCVANFKPTVS